jgi:hypothetical protein
MLGELDGALDRRLLATVELSWVGLIRGLATAAHMSPDIHRENVAVRMDALYRCAQRLHV